MNLSEDISASTDPKNAAIERALEPIRDDLEKVDLEFRKNLQSDVSIISAIGEYVLSSGGSGFAPSCSFCLRSCADTRATVTSLWPASLNLFTQRRCSMTMWWTRPKFVEATRQPIPNGATKRVSWSETFSSPRVFPFWSKKGTGKFFRSFHGPRPSWQRENWKN